MQVKSVLFSSSFSPSFFALLPSRIFRPGPSLCEVIVFFLLVVSVEQGSVGLGDVSCASVLSHYAGLNGSSYKPLIPKSALPE